MTSSRSEVTTTSLGDPRRGRGPRWREEMRAASLCNLVAGLWIAAAPWGLDYSSDEAITNSVVTGTVIAVLAFVRVGGAYRSSWMSWINAFAGAWLAVSAFVLPHSGIALWNSLVFGITVFGLACWSARASELRWLR